ncbi:MAG: cysteine peptidase family C39 domain-containing protein, partial [Mucilaginibacter sp.]
MNKNLKLIMTTFTRQRDLNDCGIACLLSVFKYGGIEPGHIASERNDKYSLLDLHKMAAQAGLHSSCVRMDIITLRDNPSPCILHVTNDAGQPHFVVHYPYRTMPGFHLIGDPDHKVGLIGEDLLLKKWESKAALYFENIGPRTGWSYRFYPWNMFLDFKFLPKTVWWSVPFLNVVAALLGLSLSVIIQKALEPGFLNRKQTFFIVLFVLVVLISVARCSINYLRQWMLISMGSKIDSKLTPLFSRYLHHSLRSSIGLVNQYYLKTAAEIQKIHQAAALLIGIVFSDGLLVMAMLAGLLFYQPAFVMLELLVIVAMFITVDRYLPLLLIHSDKMQMPAVNTTHKQGTRSDQIPGEMECLDVTYLRINDDYSKTARYLSGITNKINFSFEIISTVNIILILILSICKLQRQFISYESFIMIILLCYGFGTLMAKICSQLFIIAQGADMLRRNRSPA